jgi:hypothetical protein
VKIYFKRPCVEMASLKAYSVLIPSQLGNKREMEIPWRFPNMHTGDLNYRPGQAVRFQEFEAPRISV